jgi:hypothetical protein
VRRAADDDSDDGGDALEGAQDDAFDMEIEDEAAFEASRREVESLYEAWDAVPPPTLSQEDVLWVLDTVCVTSFAQLQVAYDRASATVNELNKEFVKRSRLVEAGRYKPADLERWRVQYWSTYYQVSSPSIFPPSYIVLNGVQFYLEFA